MINYFLVENFPFGDNKKGAMKGPKGHFLRKCKPKLPYFNVKSSQFSILRH
jgi:hypothetical protein